MSKVTTLRLTAFDTLFFRESRPFESIGGSELASVFPPPPRTVLGAVRAAIGDAMGVNWQTFKDNKAVRDVIGYGDDLGQLSLNGIWLSRLKDGKHERLYPVPLYLLRKQEGEAAAEFERLRIGKPTRTHLGKVRLPALPDKKFGFKPLENHWVTAGGLEKILAGASALAKDELISSKDLFEREARLGIARNNETRIVQEGLLYQSSHIRPKSELSLEVELTGIPDAILNQHVLRLGAEGRMAGLEVVQTLEKSSLPTAPTPTNETRGLIITFLTPARFADGSWVLPKFTDSISDIKCWTGEINGIALTLHAAVIGKAQREGGWDMAQHKPRDMQSFIPAGSSYYVEVADRKQLENAIKILHGLRIGEDTKLGRGLIACGLWNKPEFIQEETAQ